MSYGIPCVSSKFDGYEDVIKENVNGFSYPQGKINELTKILSSNELNQLSSENIKNSIEEFYSKAYYKK